jgi:hypothetical protein
VGSTLALVRWLDSGLMRDAAVYAVAAALIPYYHYVSLPILGVHAVYALARIREGGTVRLKQLAVTAAATGVLTLPMVPPLLKLVRSGQEHAFLSSPGLPNLAEMLAPPVLLFGAGMGLLAAWLICGKLSARRPAVASSTVWLLITLTLGQALLAFAVSLVSPIKIFTERYLIGSFTGMAMVVGWGIGLIQPRVARSVITCSIVVLSLGSFGYTRRFWPPHNTQDWRGALTAVRQVAGTTDIPVLVMSSFPESSRVNLDFTRKLPGWVVGPLLIYPAAGHVFPVGVTFDSASRSYLEASVAPAIDREGRFIFVNLGLDAGISNWMNVRFPGYSARPLGDFGSVNAILYERVVGARF